MWATLDSMVSSHGLCHLRLIPTINKNINYELWLLKKFYLGMSGIMGSYSCIAQLSFEGTYGMFLLCYDDLCNEYVYVLCL